MRRNLTRLVWVLSLCYSATASAEIRPDKIHVADSKKNLSYIRDGLFIGGDKAIDEVVVKDIRRAPNTGFERIVIDLEGTRNGEPTAIQRPPYFQLSVTPDEKRLVFTLWGKPKLSFDSRKVIEAFKKSDVIKAVTLLPRLEEDTWTFVFELKGNTPVEVFELSNPVRVILDVKSSGRKPVVAHSQAKAHAPVRAPKKQAPKPTVHQLESMVEEEDHSVPSHDPVDTPVGGKIDAPPMPTHGKSHSEEE